MKNFIIFFFLIISNGLSIENINMKEETINLARPLIFVNSTNNTIHTYSQDEISFFITIIPYQKDNNNLKGLVYSKNDENGSPVADIEFAPINETEPHDGDLRTYVAKVNKKLLAGNGIAREYTIKLSHELLGKQGDTSATLNVYPTINEDEVTKLERQLMAFANFGDDFFFNFTPPSGRKIAPDQFGYYFKTDGDSQDRGLIPGLKAEKSDKLNFPSNANEASLKIVWVDPVSKKEVEVFPEKTVTIQQAPPSISTGQAQSNIAGDDILSVRISNIRVTPPIVGEPNLEFGVDLPPTDVQVRGYSLVGKPTITKYGESYYIDFKLIGEPNKEGYAKGNLKLTLTAFAINPENGVISELVRKPYTINISKKVENYDDLQNNFGLINMNNNNIKNIIDQWNIKEHQFLYVYELLNTQEIKEIKDAKKTATQGETDLKDAEEVLYTVSAEIQNLVKQGVLDGKSNSGIQQDIIRQGYDLPDPDTFKKIFDYFFVTLINSGPQLYMKVYVITTQPEKVGDIPSEIIATIIVEKPFEKMSSNVKDNLEFVDPTNIFSYRMMKAEEIDRTKYSYENMYELVNSSFKINEVKFRNKISISK